MFVDDFFPLKAQLTEIKFSARAEYCQRTPEGTLLCDPFLAADLERCVRTSIRNATKMCLLDNSISGQPVS